jgi:hypothetical protein
VTSSFTSGLADGTHTLVTRVLAIALSEVTVSEAHGITIFAHGDHMSVSLHLKLPADSSLRAAHEVAERVERAISGLPHVSDVRAHLEPLERPVATDPIATENRRTAVEPLPPALAPPDPAHALRIGWPEGITGWCRHTREDGSAREQEVWI